MPENRQWMLQQRPVGDDFAAAITFEPAPMPAPKDGEVLLRTQYLSLDPANRLWMKAEPSYRPPLDLGKPPEGGMIAKVVASHRPDLKAGDHVFGVGPWAEYFVPAEGTVNKLDLDPALPLHAYLSVVGYLGWTAYFGLLDVTDPKPGETLVVSGAAGAVGSLVGQIGKAVGCRVIGIAGNDHKCRSLTEELGFDAAINYRSENVEARLRQLAPPRADGGGGVDIYFENVGGAVGNAVLRNLATKARVSLCGLISQYNDVGASAGLDLSPVLMRRAQIKGFLVFEYFARGGEANARLAQWLKEGKIKEKVDIVDGIEHTLTAFARLFASGGEHQGKLLVRFDPSAR